MGSPGGQANRGVVTPDVPIYGLMAEFAGSAEFLHAIRQVRAAGYRKMDAFSPNPVDGLSEAMELPGTPIPRIVLTGGILGALTGYGLQYWANALDYPINVGGRPLNSWVSFIPITFELAVLFASLSALIFGVLASNRLPEPYHPVFNVPAFARASRDRFFVCIEAADPLFDPAETRRVLEELDPVEIYDVEE